MTCDEVRQLAPEAALDILDAEVRADVLAHVATCPPCRRELAELSAAADALLLVTTPAEAPAGFEGRVLERMRVDPGHAFVARRRRRWVAPAVAAAAALVLGLGGGYVVRGGDGTHGRPVAAALLAADGHMVGQVLVSDHPNRMVCVLDSAPAGSRYSVSVTARDSVADVGTFTTDGPGYAWTAQLPVDGAVVRRVEIRGPDGQVRATATIPA